MGKVNKSDKVRRCADALKNLRTPQKTAKNGILQSIVRKTVFAHCAPSPKTLGFLRGAQERRNAPL